MKKFNKLVVVLLVVMLTFSVFGCAPKTPTPEKNSIVLSESAVSLLVDGNKTITATVKPVGSTVVWSSSDTAVATVVAGKIVAVKAGTAIITAKNGDASATCTVTVTAKSVTLSSLALSIEIGTFSTLTATPSPTDMSLTWLSSDNAVATVVAGKVTAMALGTANITVTGDDCNAVCAVTVTPIPDNIEEEINKTVIMKSETKDIVNSNFATNSGIFTLAEGAVYDATAKGVKLSDNKYMFTKLQLPQITKKYSYGGKDDWVGIALNSRNFVRFEALGDGLVTIYGINEDLQMMALNVEPIVISDINGKYQIEIPAEFANTLCGVAVKNAAPAESGTNVTVTSFTFATELYPNDHDAYYKDMFDNSIAADNGTEPYAIDTSGWGAFNGVSRGDLGGNYATYLDGFGAALDFELPADAAAKANKGNAIYAKLAVPTGAKKLTYFIGHVNGASAYRIQAYDGTTFTTLTKSLNPDNINTNKVNVGEGWLLTAQKYDGTEKYEVAIPEALTGKNIMIIFSAKGNTDANSVRINNIAFSKTAIIVPPSIIDGIDIDILNAKTAITASSYTFTDAASASGFDMNWGATVNGGINLTGVTPATEAKPANAAISAKITLPAFADMRLTISGDATKSAQVRVRMIDFTSKKGYIVLPWQAVIGTSAQVIQIQGFPELFKGTVGLVIESKYTVPATAAALKITKLEFASRVRDAQGYDKTAMAFVPKTAVNATNAITFDEAEYVKWGRFTANTDTNTKVFLNKPWGVQLQASAAVGNKDFSSQIAAKIALPTLANLDITAATIDIGTLPSLIRVRALKADGTFINFTKTDITDANGWFDIVKGANKTACDAWGFKYTTSIGVPTELKGAEVTLVVEFKIIDGNYNWNSIINTLQFKA